MNCRPRSAASPSPSPPTTFRPRYELSISTTRTKVFSRFSVKGSSEERWAKDSREEEL